MELSLRGVEDTLQHTATTVPLEGVAKTTQSYIHWTEICPKLITPLCSEQTHGSFGNLTVDNGQTLVSFTVV